MMAAVAGSGATDAGQRMLLADGFILAGGLSSRMGQNKAMLPVGGRTLVEHIAAQMLPVTGSVRLVGDRGVYSHLGFDVVPDVTRNCGPVAGIVTSLKNSAKPWTLVVACDLPYINSSALANLLNGLNLDPHVEAVVPGTADGRIHPLCAVYRTSTLRSWETALWSGRLKVRTVLEDLTVQVMPQKDGRWLTNVNTPSEWDVAQKEAI